MSSPSSVLAIAPVLAQEHSWRKDAARIVEELFPVTPAETWNLLLDLRQALLSGRDWNRALDLFLMCRERLEADHYLPFYRLRRLLSASLRIEAIVNEDPAEVAPLKLLLRRKYRSLADLQRTVRRDLFEAGHDPASIPSVGVQIIRSAEELPLVG